MGSWQSAHMKECRKPILGLCWKLEAICKDWWRRESECWMREGGSMGGEGGVEVHFRGSLALACLNRAHLFFFLDRLESFVSTLVS